MTKQEVLKKQFEKAVKRLEEVLQQPKNEFMRDSAIQRFEFTLDLAWKTIKSFLEIEKGIVCMSPKDCIREAYKQEVIEYDEFWLKMVDMRNEAAHIYSEEKAEEIYAALPESIKRFYEVIKYLGVEHPKLAM
ncbi:MAG: HI0074 family nucleotidyltransferase substrate-binding subunit [Nanoarchaeota archaeon]|nr:HI0074 family nucleotidyltransferase substrate-binding subunit [Nanoarchaeota archaeon]